MYRKIQYNCNQWYDIMLLYRTVPLQVIAEKNFVNNDL